MQGWTLPDLDTLPTGMALPLLEAFQRCRSQPPTEWPPEAYILIGRDDMAANRAMMGAPAPETEDLPTAVGSPIPAWTKSPIKRRPVGVPGHTPHSTTSTGSIPHHERAVLYLLFFILFLLLSLCLDRVSLPPAFLQVRPAHETAGQQYNLRGEDVNNLFCELRDPVACCRTLFHFGHRTEHPRPVPVPANYSQNVSRDIK